MINPTRQAVRPLAHPKLLGGLILAGTWVFGLLGIYFVIVPSNALPIDEKSTGWPVNGYYPLAILLLSVIIWLWSIFAWMGMKFFRHAG